MEYKFYSDIFFDLWPYRENNCLLGRVDDEVIMSLVFIDIVQTFPGSTRDRYGMEIINSKCLVALDDYSYKHVLIFSKPDEQQVESFLQDLARKCGELGEVWETILDYADSESSSWFCPGERALGPVIDGHEPKISWYVESGRNLEGVSEPFDERIVADVAWVDEVGEIVTFRGYWYAVSTAYVEARLLTQDPYYRRHVYITKKFKTAILIRCFGRTMAHLSQIPLEYRLAYCFEHFEYDGQSMLYER